MGVALELKVSLLNWLGSFVITDNSYLALIKHLLEGLKLSRDQKV
jgi:hypothetical protein